MPLVMMLHGYSGASQSVRYTFPLAEEFGVIVIAPESRDLTWGQSAPGFDPDVKYLGAAYRHVDGMLDIDKTHVALAGQSTARAMRSRWGWRTATRSTTS